MSSKGFVVFLILLAPVVLLVAATADAATYYVDRTHAQASDSNSGSEAQPWMTIRRAADVAAAGDTVYVKGNGVTYTEPDPSPAWTVPTLNPKNNGTASQPITFSAYPGHRVTITNNSWAPVIGAGSRNYVIWQGFTINKSVGGGGGYFTAISGGSSGSQLRYNEIIGTSEVTDPSAMYTGILVHSAGAAVIRHNIMGGFRGSSLNQAGIIVYHSTGTIIEDNYARDNWVGLFSKRWNNNVTWRRNYSTNNQGVAMAHNASSDPTLFEVDTKIYDNVFSHYDDLFHQGRGFEIHDNLYLSSGLRSFRSTVDTISHLHIWNNVVLGTGSPIMWYQLWSRTGNEWDYFDYNVYAGTPAYRFGANGATQWNMTQMRAAGFETHSQQSIAQSNIYDSTWNLKAPFTTAGRHGDAVGPGSGNDGLVRQIMDTSRYGPTALGNGGGDSTAPATPKNLRIAP